MIHISDDKLLICDLLLLMSVVACEKEILTFTAHEGGSVEIRCPYEEKYEENDKYLCRGKCPIGNKNIIVKSGSEPKDKRFSLTDNKTKHISTVNITDLRAVDQGQYWCGISTGLGLRDVYKEIDLRIINVSRVSAESGKHLTIPCHYERGLKDDVKFLCKRSDSSSCATSAIKVSSESAHNGRFSLRDDKSEGVFMFTVTITNLTQEDSGIYWCGAAEKGKAHEEKWISVVDLLITDVSVGDHASNPMVFHVPVSSERTPFKTTTASSFHTSTPETAAVSSSRPATSSSSPSPSPSTPAPVLLFFPSATDAASPKPQSGFTTLVMLTVIGILTGFGISLFVYLRWRQKRAGRRSQDGVHGPIQNLPNGDAGTTGDDTHTACDYEDIRVIPDHPVYSSVCSVFDEHDDSVYALAQLPSSPSEDPNYSFVQFSSTHHSDRTSDRLEKCEYATVIP